MAQDKEKMAAPIPPVGVGGEQPISKKPSQSITEPGKENNLPEKNFEKMMRQM